ncbi:MAG: hypothetical protein CK424_05665 [Legionella sp.]|nr:MAG: hypothetical protein CK424_05665 [Legionella sp.]
MNIDTLIENITHLHRNAIQEWSTADIQLQHDGLLKLVEENHSFNFQLWRAEDRARREDMGHSFVYHAKRDIDHYNQQRNNRMEAIDGWLADTLELSSHKDCPIHSETPGMMIDRLSILSLKSYHMGLQAVRPTADDAHRQLCAQKLETLHAQHKHLTSCLQQLLKDLTLQLRTFYRYHQFKMYNDPTLNPELYSHTE